MTKAHKGIDLASPVGTHVLAAADGCISKIGTNPNSGNGIFISLAHGNGIESEYLHLSRLASTVRGGACFHRGDLIGYVGSTGNVTGPNLHFEVKRDGVPVDPMPYIIAAAKPPMAFRVRCSDVPEYPVLDEAMANALSTPSGSARRAGSSR